MTDKVIEQDEFIPVIPLKDVVIFPNMVIPLFVGRQKSINALEMADRHDGRILLLSQQQNIDGDINEDNLYEVGIMAKILQILQLPDNTKKVLIEGKFRAKVLKIHNNHDLLMADITELVTKNDLSKNESEAQKREAIQLFEEFAKLNQKIPDEMMSIISKISQLDQLVDVIITHVITDLETRQELLETVSLKKRLAILLRELNREIEIFNIEKKIQGRVKQQIEKNQKEYYLHEQQRAILQELGEDDVDDVQELENKIYKAKMPDNAEKKALSELKKLKLMPQVSSESALLRNYLEHLVEIPWNKLSKISYDIYKAKKILDKDHYGLDKIKERILEYIAVQRRVQHNKAQILCLVGPPGVGKTSLGESIAHAMNRKYIRIALGGLHDESEIRGHRRTYIGAMCGKFVKAIIDAGANNPLILLDEIDKIGTDYRGDPGAALLEVLDPEQNKFFVDNYTEIPLDLSQVMFICTANTTKFSPALRDRMEIIRLSGYTEEEKLNIAESYLLPKQLKANGLKAAELKIDSDTMRDIVRHFTIEAGVRNLNRQIGKICRKSVMAIDDKSDADNLIKKIKISISDLQKYLGSHVNDFNANATSNRIGRVNGLAWTEVGGEVLTIESVAIKGKGVITRTGNLGDVMKESIQAAITVVRSRSAWLGIDEQFYETQDLHVHVPEGATPKDGPSAGIAMVTAIASSLNKVPVRSDIAMTGEVTLYGDVLPIGGLKEKMLAALRIGIKTVIIPAKNHKDLYEISKDILDQLTIIPASTIDTVMEHAFEYKPTEKVM